MSIELAPIPGPPTIVVSKASGAVRTFVGAMVPLDRRENDQRSNAYRIGVGEHRDGQLAYLRLRSASGVLGSPAISALLEVEMLRQENTRYFIATRSGASTAPPRVSSLLRPSCRRH